MPYRSLKKIIETVFPEGGVYNGSEEFLEKIKDQFPNLNKNYNIPYEKFLSFCVNEFSAVKESLKVSIKKEAAIGLHPFKERWEDYKHKKKINPDVKIYDKLQKFCRRSMKKLIPGFIDLVTMDCDIDDIEEFEDVKEVIKELLLIKCNGLMESIIANNKEMWFNLLSLDTPDETDVEFLEQVAIAWSELIRDEDKHQKLGDEDHRQPGIMNTEAEIKDLQDLKVTNFCKMMICNPKMSQEICRLIIYLTNHTK